MNCPGHVQIFNRTCGATATCRCDGEFGSCHRNEPSGALHGIMRVRAFTQDDGKIFCSAEQIQPKVVDFHLLERRSTATSASPTSSSRSRSARTSGSAAMPTGTAPRTRCAAVLAAGGMQWTELPGEGAFYGPKIEYHLKDSIGRSWQCGTMQVDFQMPGRLGAEFVDEDNGRKVPVMLHRAIVGSLERFIGILIEHRSGALPLWLAPVQAIVLNISDRQDAFARIVEARGRPPASARWPTCETRK